MDGGGCVTGGTLGTVGETVAEVGVEVVVVDVEVPPGELADVAPPTTMSAGAGATPTDSPTVTVGAAARAFRAGDAAPASPRVPARIAAAAPPMIVERMMIFLFDDFFFRTLLWGITTLEAESL
jgi:hypothetical protein